ncbi:MAG: tRNA lysidine(34) synthetase TilS, partial [Pseudomonadota bacterium]|nr:tRNA lysidine(34) synthetase TilS [Pseudomonadota bacterium]
MAAAPSSLVLPQVPGGARDDRLCVGYSGGLDSTVLLHLASAAAAWQGRLQALHVHHGLQPEADTWVAHCRRVCAGLGVPLQVLRVEVDRSSGEGLEAAARQARHAAFASVLEAGDVLALAHHQDDQAETFLLRALRASGVDGLAAMRAWRAYGDAWLWRPLLAHPRAAVLAHARSHGLCWIDDPGNNSLQHDRNFLRQRVLPVLRQRWPQAGAALAASAGLSAEAGDLLRLSDEVVRTDVRGPQPGTLSIAGLRALTRTRRARVLRHWIIDCGLPPLPARGVAQIEATVLPARADALAEFAWGDAIVRAWSGAMHAEVRRPALPANWEAGWDGRAPLQLPAGGTLQLEGVDALPDPVVVHARRGGERILLPGRVHGHALK